MKKKAIQPLRVQALFQFSTGQRQTGTTFDPTLTTITITTTGLPHWQAPRKKRPAASVRACVAV